LLRLVILQQYNACYSTLLSYNCDDIIIQANSPQVPTCVIRPAAIYGPGEERHFPRIVRTIDSGLFLVRIGHALVDWVHVDNLVGFCESYQTLKLFSCMLLESLLCTVFVYTFTIHVLL
jgi:hypothetical protein